MGRKLFTLLELVVVIAIIAITTTLAVSAFRGESPVQKMNNAALGFESWCARVRYAAMENGADRIVAFNPDERVFLGHFGERNAVKPLENDAEPVARAHLAEALHGGAPLLERLDGVVELEVNIGLGEIGEIQLDDSVLSERVNLRGTPAGNGLAHIFAQNGVIDFAHKILLRRF